MSKDKHHEPIHEMELEVPPVIPGHPKWESWLLDLHVAIQDMEAVTRDQLRKERKRDPIPGAPMYRSVRSPRRQDG